MKRYIYLASLLFITSCNQNNSSENLTVSSYFSTEPLILNSLPNRDGLNNLFNQSFMTYKNGHIEAIDNYYNNSEQKQIADKLAEENSKFNIFSENSKIVVGEYNSNYLVYIKNQTTDLADSTYSRGEGWTVEIDKSSGNVVKISEGLLVSHNIIKLADGFQQIAD